jgi:hypothetical protein
MSNPFIQIEESPLLERHRVNSLKAEIKELSTRFTGEKESEAHQTLRYHDRRTQLSSPGFDQPGVTGVIYVMDRAAKYGYKYGDPSWSNFGQVLILHRMLPHFS